MTYRLDALTASEAQQWDELIGRFENRELFHRKAWLDYLAASRGVEIRMWAIKDGGVTVGYLCGGIVQKGPFRIFGSPLKGWGTNFMGPVTNGRIDQRELLRALDALARRERVAMAEIENRLFLDDPLVESHYQPLASRTFLVPLTPGRPEAMWQGLRPTARNRIRKALRAGLTVDVRTDDTIADEFFDQYLQVMQKKHTVPPYPRETPRLMVQHLGKAGLIFTLRVRDRDGRLLATGLFPHDDKTMYFWGGASWQEGRELCPNDYLHWCAMRLAAERGLELYNMCGDGQFKKKFGGELVTIKRWQKCYWRSARWAQRGYEFYFQKRSNVRAWLQRVAGVYLM